MSQNFSDRFGFKPAEPEITIREDAPDDLRFAIAQIAVNAGMGPSDIRDVVCTVLFVAPDRNNWSEYPNIWDEVRGLLEDCEWFKVYDTGPSNAAGSLSARQILFASAGTARKGIDSTPGRDTTADLNDPLGNVTRPSRHCL
ncbi:AbiJ-NTD4 domain-containing protein [Mesorhizobium erdmanii]|uniref:AbiJ-NTD4 domain-containing protein n=1 Tax=Mesorhizobium erdmanii TaxID=1777866 RepID=UPI000420191C|nr:hypothetical protein [Mesorhizobium erdmanii]